MFKPFILIFILFQLWGILIPNKNRANGFFSLQNSMEYNLIEYLLISNNDSDVFILNQPYDINSVFNLLQTSDLVNDNLLKTKVFSVFIQL